MEHPAITGHLLRPLHPSRAIRLRSHYFFEAQERIPTSPPVLASLPADIGLSPSMDGAAFLRLN